MFNPGIIPIPKSRDLDKFFDPEIPGLRRRDPGIVKISFIRKTRGVPEPVVIVIKLIKIVIESFSVSNERRLRFSDRILSPALRCAAW